MKKPGKMIAETLAHLFKKPATVAYPFETFEMPKDFRGKIRFIAERCVGCKLCMKDCPAGAITISQVGDKADKRFECTIHLDQCMYCGQCVQSCNKDALESTMEFELAQLDRKNLVVTFHARPKEETATKDSAATPGNPALEKV